jgi:phage host-nuclease inhibitor protein Gam
MQKRIKTAVAGLKTRDDIEQCVERIARATIARDGLMAEMDQELTDVRARFEPQITAYGQAIEGLMGQAQAWSEDYPEEFGARKSLDLVHGVIGFRVGTPKLKLLSGWTWARVLEVLKVNELRIFVRTKEEVDREGIIAQRNDLSAETLKKMGVKVAQDETFFCEPKRETVGEP